MSIGIFAVKQTTLIIDTTGVPELLSLEQMGREHDPIALDPGVNKIPVGVGVYRVLSNEQVKVTANTSEAHIIALTKDGGSPDPPKAMVHLDAVAVRSFFAAATSLGESAPV